jgi:hypothetical protein
VISAGVLLLAGALALAVCVLPFGWPCAWKAATGVPCAGCGGTRSLLFLLGGDWQAALQLNPGVILAGGLLLLANVYAAAVLVLRIGPWRPVLRGWRWALGGAVALNWAYLVAVSRP